MEILLAILLYLQVIVSPGTYTTVQINQYEQIHRPQIEQVQNDPQAMQVVNDVYLPQVEHITIPDDSATK